MHGYHAFDFKDENLRRRQRPAETGHHQSRPSCVSAEAPVRLFDESQLQQLGHGGEQTTHREGSIGQVRAAGCGALKSQKQYIENAEWTTNETLDPK